MKMNKKIMMLAVIAAFMMVAVPVIVAQDGVNAETGDISADGITVNFVKDVDYGDYGKAANSTTTSGVDSLGNSITVTYDSASKTFTFTGFLKIQDLTDDSTFNRLGSPDDKPYGIVFEITVPNAGDKIKIGTGSEGTATEQDKKFQSLLYLDLTEPHIGNAITYTPLNNGAVVYKFDLTGLYEAKIGDVYYATFEDAVSAADSESTIELLKDVTLETTLTVSKKISITGEYEVSAASNFSTPSKNAMIYVTSVGDLTINGPTFDANGKSRAILNEGGKLTLTTGTVTGGYVNNTYVAGIYNTSNGVFNMTGGTITGNTIAGTYASDNYCQYSADLWIGANATGDINALSGGTVGNVFVNANSYSAQNPGSLTFNGVTATNVYVEYDDNYGAVLNYTGGTITNLFVSTTTSGTSVKAAPVTGTTYIGGMTFEAKIGDVYYATFEDAVSAAASESTITLLKDITVTAKSTIDKSLTIYGKKDATRNYSITATSGNYIFEVVSGAFKLQNVDCTYNGGYVVKVPGSTASSLDSIAIENCTLSAKTPLYFADGTPGSRVNSLSITDSTLVATATDAYGCIYSYDLGTVSITGSALTGKVTLAFRGNSGSLIYKPSSVTKLGDAQPVLQLEGTTVVTTDVDISGYTGGDNSRGTMILSGSSSGLSLSGPIVLPSTATVDLNGKIFLNDVYGFYKIVQDTQSGKPAYDLTVAGSLAIANSIVVGTDNKIVINNDAKVTISNGATLNLSKKEQVTTSGTGCIEVIAGGIAKITDNYKWIGNNDYYRVNLATGIIDICSNSNGGFDAVLNGTATVPSGKELVIWTNDALTIDGELTNSGTITNAGKIYLNGTLTSAGTEATSFVSNGQIIIASEGKLLGDGMVNFGAAPSGTTAFTVAEGGVISAILNGGSSTVGTVTIEYKVTLKNVSAGTGGFTVTKGSVYINGALATPDENGVISVTGTDVVYISGSVEEGVTINVASTATLEVAAGASLTLETGAALVGTVTIEVGSGSSVTYEEGSTVNGAVIEVTTKIDENGEHVVVLITLKTANADKLLLKVNGVYFDTIVIGAFQGDSFADALAGVEVESLKSRVSFDGWYNVLNEKVTSGMKVGSAAPTLTAKFTETPREGVTPHTPSIEPTVITVDETSGYDNTTMLVAAVAMLVVAIFVLGYVVIVKRK